MPGRSFNTSSYDYGFQGQLKDDEISGTGNHISWRYRGYDTRLGRFWSTDPLEPKYPMYSPYHFSSNQPIHAPELEGLESSVDLNLQRWDREYIKDEITREEYLERHKSLGQGGLFAVSLISPVDEFMVVGVALKGLWRAWRGAKTAKQVVTKADEVADAAKASRTAKNPYLNKTKQEVLDSKESYEKLLKEHKEKLAKFKEDPIGNTDPKKLAEMKRDNPTDEVLLERAKGRIPALEKQIKKHEGELDKIDKALKTIENGGS